MDPDDDEARGGASKAFEAEADGEVEWDTQHCRNLQDELLSSSPDNLNNNNNNDGDNDDHHDNDDHRVESAVVAEDIDEEVPSIGRLIGPSSHAEQLHQLPSTSNAPTRIVGNDGPQFPAALTNYLTLQRDANGKLGTLDAAGRFVVPTRLNQTRSDMEDSTQISSLSPTQQNSESAYEQFALRESGHTPLAAEVPEKKRSQQAHTGHDSLLAKQHSEITDSTAYTYGENDIGHVHFDEFVADENPGRDNSPEMEESMSQDAPFVPTVPEFQPYEPQTPAPPINPFSHKGSVLKAHEMFKATQPSSIGRLMTSAASSRPSPDVYNDFTSPGKWAPPSSPLARHFEPVETSPLQSSVRTLLRSKSIDLPNEAITHPALKAQSFDVTPRFPPQSSMRGPLEYVSMKESQERRKKETSPVLHSDSETESDLDDIPTTRQRQRRQREQEIQRQLSAIELRKHVTPSGKPVSPSPGDVEVPSTSNRRRRSLQEDYIAQCKGTDARDTQQDDVIMDSQAVPDNAVGPEQAQATTGSNETATRWKDSSDPTNANITASQGSPACCHATEVEPVPGLDANTNSDQTSSAPEGPGSPFQQPSLPLNEVSSNRSDLRTPLITKTQVFSDGVDMTVPETSPPEDPIRPMGEITNISFGESNTQELLGLPGFTQDVEFENAIMPRSSPDPSPKPRTSGRNIAFPSSAPTTSELAAPSVPGGTEEPNKKQPTPPPATSPLEQSMITNHSNDTPANSHGVAVVIRSPKLVVDNEAIRIAHDENKLENQANGGLESVTQEPTKNDSRPSKAKLKGPSRVLRRSGAAPSTHAFTTPEPSQVKKSAPITKTSTTPSSESALPSPAASSSPISSISSISTPRSAVTRSSTQKAREKSLAPISRSQITAIKTKTGPKKTPSSRPAERPSKRKVTIADDTVLPKRASKRQSTSTTRESSTDPLSLPYPPVATSTQHNLKLFTKMAFAVSYNDQKQEKDTVTAAIAEGGGSILEDGFDSLFESASASKSRARPGTDEELVISRAARKLGFVALIADEHSRKVKYMQALALGLPCISGRWISECVLKSEIVDWAPYLLCAGQSSFLGNAIRSRTLLPYPAATATFPETFSKRVKLLDGKSILVITGKGSASEKRRHYLFLTRVLGPARIEQVTDLEQARKTLLDSAGQQTWDLVYVDENEDHAGKVIFGQTPTASAGSKKRKKGPIAAKQKATPERIRIISDEVVIQSLILGQWME